MKPIEIWNEVTRSNMSVEEIRMQLDQVYQNNKPFIAEIIMNSNCPNSCRHCIYAPDFEMYNKNMDWEKWRAAFHTLHDDLGFKRFIFDGRALTTDAIKAIRFLKTEFSGVKVGLIAEGITLEPLLKEVIDCPPDWLDISVDGLEDAHDLQRNNKGAYAKTIDALMQLKESGAFEKINILTCLTTINIGSITGLISFLNNHGFKNFFITPVTVSKGFRPDPGLQPSKEGFIELLDELMAMSAGLHDSWVEMVIYDIRYVNAIKCLRSELYKALKPNHDHLEYMAASDVNEFHISYYPGSLTGIREFIINSDGRIIPPKVMSMGKIPDALVMGNICDQHHDSNLFNSRNIDNVLNLFVEELCEEKQLLAV